jgi:hypothetical protein
MGTSQLGGYNIEIVGAELQGRVFSQQQNLFSTLVLKTSNFATVSRWIQKPTGMPN